LRHIRLHERVNDLPDANYATLKYFMGHLYKYGSEVRIAGRTHAKITFFWLFSRIVQYEAQNSMSIGNLAIVFGPTLFHPTAPHGGNGQDGLVGATIQNKVRHFLPPRRALLSVSTLVLSGDRNHS